MAHAARSPVRGALESCRRSVGYCCQRSGHLQGSFLALESISARISRLSCGRNLHCLSTYRLGTTLLPELESVLRAASPPTSLALQPGAPSKNLGFHTKTSPGQKTQDSITVIFVDKAGNTRSVSTTVGSTILQAAHENDIELEGACEASCACSTCHVILDPHIYEGLPEPSEAEEDMLDMAPCLSQTSRLGCQVVLTRKMNGCRIFLPSITRNFYVDGHVPKPH